MKVSDSAFAEVLTRLDARQETRWELGLERMRGHLKALGDPHSRLRCIHVAGTNGKGSVCAILERVLREAGCKTGLYTSPHLADARERIRLDGDPAGPREFARALDRALADERLTYFEALTSAAFQIFAARRVEAVILETGLGGRLDATNVIEAPPASVITSIGLDHTAWLGKTVAAIAAEKGGIIKPRSPVFVGDLSAALRNVVRKIAVFRGSPFHSVPNIFRSVRSDFSSNRQEILGPGGESFQLGLLGARQPANVSLARAVLDGLAAEFPVSKTAWRRGLALVRWPGRFEVIKCGDKTAIVDGAHNPDAFSALLETLRTSPWRARNCLFFLGFLKDKDVSGMLRLLIRSGLRDAVAVSPPSPRALEPRVLADILRRLAPKARLRVEPDPGRAIARWLSNPQAPETGVICGSLYLAGRARECLRGIRGRK